MLNIFCAGFLGLFSMILAQFTLEMCSRHKIAKNLPKNHTIGVQGRSRSSMLVQVESSSAVLVMIRSKSVSICNCSECSHARRANRVNNYFIGGTRLWCPRSRRISSPSGMKFGHNKLETLRYHTVETQSLYFTWTWIGTESWQTDGQTELQ